MNPPYLAVDAASAPPGKSSIPCLVCRSRKVRCDKTLPECRNCERLGVKCPRYNVDTQTISRSEINKSAEDIFKAAGVEKRRVGSCEECQHTATQSTTPYETSYAVPRGQGIGWDQRLYTETLPDDRTLRTELVETFFDRSHSLRCLGFLHRETFLHSLERESVVQDYGQPLLYAIHLHFDSIAAGHPVAAESQGVPGALWAERARREVLMDVASPSVNHIMAMVLLCDYGVRSDQNSMVFILVAFLYRVIRLHGLDSFNVHETLQDYEAARQREVETRLVWACYFIDLFTATGVEKNACWHGEPTLPLPILDRTHVTHYVQARHTLKSIDANGVHAALNDLDLSGILVLVVRLRRTTLRLIRTHAQDLDTPIWDPASPFLQNIQRLDEIYQNLPPRYQLTDAIIPILRERRILGGVFLLHFMLHAVASDLTRISLPGFNFPLAPIFNSATSHFRSHCQERCRHHARQTTNLVRQGLSIGRGAFDDIYAADAALEAAKIQIIYAATVNQSPEVIQETRDNLTNVLYFYDLFHKGKSGTSQYIRTVMPLCFLFGFRDVAEPYRRRGYADDNEAEVVGSADIDHLSRFAPFRRARSELKASSVQSPVSSSSRHTHPSPARQDSMTLPPLMVPPTTVPDTAQSQRRNTQMLPVLRPAYSSFVPPDPVAVDQNYYPVQPIHSQMMSMVSDTMEGQPTMDDYIRTAGDMAGYLTWDHMEIPASLNYANFFPTG
ncbi:uncharacterized protein J7T54_001857 [Emericellopsis cladophorae]|uniref:Zn(2)-C6 fungal-type domain-containing protein n=1 Tax=Emericellopsis cladophorae TaxID=2686198 RepID=A0A9Q0BGH2_9HYPO|nr:uncharacterized protein J7T54_001857 [Emericellopsis cladophorae]KAI6783981.1 hypothetical protein J7T54_001857 [Emericellopsis cladophorae]